MPPPGRLFNGVKCRRKYTIYEYVYIYLRPSLKPSGGFWPARRNQLLPPAEESRKVKRNTHTEPRERANWLINGFWPRDVLFWPPAKLSSVWPRGVCAMAFSGQRRDKHWTCFLLVEIASPIGQAAPSLRPCACCSCSTEYGCVLYMQMGLTLIDFKWIYGDNKRWIKAEIAESFGLVVKYLNENENVN